MRVFSLFACAMLAFGQPVSLLQATDYFVSGAGNDDDVGLTSGTAFRTLTRALSVAGDGDRILVEAGQYDPAAGESFPIVVAAGVEILGPGDGSAVIDSTASTGAVLLVVLPSGPVLIEGLKIQAHETNGIAVHCVGYPEELTLRNNELSGRNGFHNLINGVPPAGGGSRILLENNTVNTGFIGLGWGFRAVTATHEVEIRNNTVTTNFNPIVLLGDVQTAGTAAVNVTITGNTVDAGGIGSAIFAGISATAGRLELDVLVEDNVVANAYNGVEVIAYGSGAGVEFEVNATITGNSVNCFGQALHGGFYGAASGFDGNCAVEIRENRVDSGTDGVRLAGEADGNDAQLVVQGTVECNTISGHSNYGMVASFQAESSGRILAAPEIRFNSFTGGNRGLQVYGLADASGLGQMRPVFRGNTVTDNSRDGVVAEFWPIGSPQVGFAPDFGASTAAGRNTIAANNTGAYSSAYDFDAGLASSVWSIPAHGNWWGAMDSAGIEPLVLDQTDDTSFADVVYAPFCVDPLTFAPSVPLQRGATALLLAGPASAFLAKSGAAEIEIELDGMAVEDLVVAPDGTSLSFTVPDLDDGTYVLRVTNPAGQTGELPVTLGVVAAPGGGGGGGGGGCFVATAAYGDIESSEVRTLRRWRDEGLAGNALGRQLVAAYYAVSPALAEGIADSPAARAVSRACLAPVVGAARLWLDHPWVYAVAAVGLAWMAVGKPRRRARQRTMRDEPPTSPAS